MRPDLDAIRAREQVATKGPWTPGIGNDGQDMANAIIAPDADRPALPVEHRDYGGALVATSMRTDDRDFVMHARTDIPALLDYIAELEHRLDTFRALLVEAEAKVTGSKGAGDG